MRKSLAIVLTALALVFTGASVATADAPPPPPCSTDSSGYPYPCTLPDADTNCQPYLDTYGAALVADEQQHSQDVQRLQDLYFPLVVKYRTTTDTVASLHVANRRKARTIRHLRAEVRALRAQLATAS